MRGEIVSADTRVKFSLPRTALSAAENWGGPFNVILCSLISVSIYPSQHVSRQLVMDIQQNQTYEMYPPRSEVAPKGPTSLEYLLNCRSHDPLKASTKLVDNTLSRYLVFDNSRPTLPYMEFGAQNRSSCNPPSTQQIFAPRNV
jgi:hypothetical protein